jgi:hypothetical protein
MDMPPLCPAAAAEMFTERQFMNEEDRPTSPVNPKKTRKKKIFIIFMIAALLLFSYDLADTWHLVKWQLSTGNRTAAESTWTHFAARNIGALIGVAIALLLRQIILRARQRFHS